MNKKSTWDDGRPVSYTSWSQKYMKEPINSAKYIFKDSRIRLQPTHLSSVLKQLSDTVQPSKQEQNVCTLGILNPQTQTLDWVSVDCDRKIHTHMVICQKGSISYEMPKVLLAFIKVGNVSNVDSGCISFVFHVAVKLTCPYRVKFVGHAKFITYALGHHKEYNEKLFKTLCRFSDRLTLADSCYACATIDDITMDKLSQVTLTNLTSYNYPFCPTFSVMHGTACVGFQIKRPENDLFPLIASNDFCLSNVSSVITNTICHFLTGIGSKNKVGFIIQDLQTVDGCFPSQYRCPLGECVSMLHVLSGVYPCSGKQHIKIAVTSDNQYRCHSGNSIPWMHVCDGTEHCPSGIYKYRQYK